MKKSSLISSIRRTINGQKSLSKSFKEELEDILKEYEGSSTRVEAYPPITEDGVLKIWCLKHQKYEPATEFAAVARSKTGYHNKCILADYQWRDYLQRIKEIDSKMRGTMEAGEFEEAKKFFEEKKVLESKKDGYYEYPDKEEIERITPRKRGSK